MDTSKAMHIGEVLKVGTDTCMLCMGIKTKLFALTPAMVANLSWYSKINHIKQIVQTRKPHVLFIEELNLWKHHDRNLAEIEGYYLHATKIIDNPRRQIFRIVDYVRQSIRVKGFEILNQMKS